jgi:hypothetical protein
MVGPGFGDPLNHSFQQPAQDAAGAIVQVVLN